MQPDTARLMSGVYLQVGQGAAHERAEIQEGD